MAKVELSLIRIEKIAQKEYEAVFLVDQAEKTTRVHLHDSPIAGIKTSDGDKDIDALLFQYFKQDFCVTLFKFSRGELSHFPVRFSHEIID